MTQRFSSALVLVKPNPSKHFMVASNVGVDTVLFLHTGPENQLNLCVFFSCSFTPCEQNYDVGNSVLLALKLAYEE